MRVSMTGINSDWINGLSSKTLALITQSLMPSA